MTQVNIKAANSNKKTLPSLKGYDFYVSSPLVKNYDAHNTFIHTEHRCVVQDENHQVLLFASGKDNPEECAKTDQAKDNLYLFKEMQGHSKPFKRFLIESPALEGMNILQIEAHQKDSNHPVLFIHTSDHEGKESILFAENLSEPERIKFSSIKLETPLDKWGFGYKLNKELTVITYHQSGQEAYLHNLQGHSVSVPLALDSDEHVEQIELGYQEDFGDDMDEDSAFFVTAITKKNEHKKLVFLGFEEGEKDEEISRLFRHEIEAINGNQPSCFGSVVSRDNEYIVQIGAEFKERNKVKTSVHQCSFALSFDDEGFNLTDTSTFMFDVPGSIDSIMLTNAKIRATQQKEGSFSAEKGTVDIIDTFYIGNYINGKKFLFRSHPIGDISALEQAEWSLPIPLMPIKDAEITRNPHTNALDIFVPMKEEHQGSEVHLSLEHHWVDDETTQWKSKNIEVLYEEPLKVITKAHNTSSTYVRIIDQKTGMPVQDISAKPKSKQAVKTKKVKNIPEGVKVNLNYETVQLSASQEVSVMVNDQNYQLHPKEYVDVPLDKMGGLSIINKTNTIQTPVYLVSFAEETEAIRIRTTQHAEEKLKDKKSQEAMMAKLEKKSGKKMKESGYNDALNKIHGTKKGLDKSDAVSVVHREATSYTQYKKLHPEHVEQAQEGFYMAYSNTKEHGSKFFTNEQHWSDFHAINTNGNAINLTASNRQLQFGNPFKFIKNVVGDVVRAVKHIAKDVTHFVIKEANGIYHLTISLAHGDFKAAIHSLEEMWETMNTFLHAILKDVVELAADLIFDVLCFIMGGDQLFKDLFLVQDALVNLIKIGSSQIKNDIKNIESIITKDLSLLKNYIDKEFPKLGESQKHDNSILLQIIEVLCNNKVLNIIVDLVSRAINKIISLLLHQSEETNPPPTLDFSKLKKDGLKSIDDILNTFENGISDIVQFKIQQLLEDLYNGMRDVADDLLDTTIDFVDEMSRFFIASIDYFQNNSAKQLSIPLISDFYTETFFKTFKDDYSSEEACKNSTEAQFSFEKAVGMAFGIPMKFILDTPIINAFDENRTGFKKLKGVANWDEFENLMGIKTTDRNRSLSAEKDEKEEKEEKEENIWETLELIAEVCESVFEFYVNVKNGMTKQVDKKKEEKNLWDPYNLEFGIGLGTTILRFIAVCTDKEHRTTESILFNAIFSIVDVFSLSVSLNIGIQESKIKGHDKEEEEKIKDLKTIVFVVAIFISIVKIIFDVYDKKIGKMVLTTTNLILVKTFNYVCTFSDKKTFNTLNEEGIPELVGGLFCVSKIGALMYMKSKE